MAQLAPVPKSFTINKELVQRLRKQGTLPDGWYYGLVRQAMCRVSKLKPNGEGNNLMIELRFSPLKDVDDVRSFSKGHRLSKYVTLPVENPDVKEHVLPESWAQDQSWEFVRALYPGEVDKPFFDAKTNQWRYNGDTIEPEQAEESEDEAILAMLEFVLEKYQDPKSIHDRCCFFQVKKDDRGKSSVDRIACKLPDGESLVPNKVWVPGKEGVTSKSVRLAPEPEEVFDDKPKRKRR